MSKKKAEENASVLETFPKIAVDESAVVEESKAVIDGVFCVDGRIAVCHSEAEAVAIYEACFKQAPVEIVASDRYPRPGEKVLHLRGDVPMYGLPE